MPNVVNNSKWNVILLENNGCIELWCCEKVGIKKERYIQDMFNMLYELDTINTVSLSDFQFDMVSEFKQSLLDDFE